MNKNQWLGLGLVNRRKYRTSSMWKRSFQKIAAISDVKTDLKAIIVTDT